MPRLIYTRCKKHETQLSTTNQGLILQVFYNGRQIAVFKRQDVMDLFNGRLNKPKQVKECNE